MKAFLPVFVKETKLLNLDPEAIGEATKQVQVSDPCTGTAVTALSDFWQYVVVRELS